MGRKVQYRKRRSFQMQVVSMVVVVKRGWLWHAIESQELVIR